MRLPLQNPATAMNNGENVVLQFEWLIVLTALAPFDLKCRTVIGYDMVPNCCRGDNSEKGIVTKMKNKILFGGLPDISFVGGGEFSAEFLMRDTAGEPFDAEGCSADFAVSRRYGDEIVTGGAEILCDDDGSFSVLRIGIPAEKTRNMRGEYIYQLSLTDIYGEIYEPVQGRMRVAPYISSASENGE